ncbi:hypothetical protein [Streptomyces lateritius]|uniref:hypothetical protein n=1 Tax=Streptomyces lateritius TaxID=67313 RepID=UPI001C8B408B|nr:hypothetical protein [Streptomyces lateritius]MBX9425568.1 hypothetical protein [Streptomyces lateritius]
MTTSERPDRPPGLRGGRPNALQEPHPGAPSRALRMRAADGWEKFMRRVEAQRDTGA